MTGPTCQRSQQQGTSAGNRQARDAVWSGWMGPRYSSRPLPAYRYFPGRDPHPTADPAGHSHADKPWFEIQGCAPEAWAQCEPYLYGADCFNHGYWWEAHEAWEPLWRGLGGNQVQTHYIQGLIQAANALLKRRMGWRSATTRLGDEVVRHLQVVDASWYMGLRVANWRVAFIWSLRPGAVTFPRLLLKPECGNTRCGS